MEHHRLAAAVAAAALTFIAAMTPPAASAQQYPTRPIHILVGFNAGSSADIVARVVGKKMEQRLGQAVVVENRSGNASMIAAEAVARAANDGYTLFMATVANTIGPARTAGKFDLGVNMAPITLLGIVPNLLVVHPSVPAHDVKELVALMKAKPESLTFGTSGAGTASHLAAELFNLKAGTKIVMVHYQGGSSQRVVDLMSGRINVAFNVAASLLPYVREGKLRAIAVAQPKRTDLVPNVPTLDEAGLPGIDARIWIGLLAPAGTAPEIVAKLGAAADEALEDPVVAKAMQTQGIDPVGGTPAEFAGFIHNDIEKWTTVLKAAGLRK